MSPAAEPSAPPELPAGWERLERAAREAAAGVAAWRRRALEAEDEVAWLRHSLEELLAERAQAGDGAPAGSVASGEAHDEIQRLRAENLALRTRMGQARRRVAVLLKRLGALEANR